MRTITYAEIKYRAAEAAGRTRDNLPVAEATLIKSALALELPLVWGMADWNELVPAIQAATVTDRTFPKINIDLTQIVVAGAGTAGVNGTYVKGVTANGKPSYALGETYTLGWIGSPLAWRFNPNLSPNVLYSSADDVATPDLATTWAVGIGAAPAPTVSAVVAFTCGDILGVYDADPQTTTRYRSIEFDEMDDVVRIHPHHGELGTVWVEYMLPCPDLLAVAAAALDAYELPEKFANWLAARAAGHLLTADGNPALAGVQFGLAKSAIESEAAEITRPPWRRAIRVRN